MHVLDVPAALSSFSSIRRALTMRPRQDFSKSFCSYFCLLLCSFLVPLGLPSHSPSMLLFVFLCFLLPPPSRIQRYGGYTLFPSILVTCLNLLSLILSTNVISNPSSFLVASFRISSFLDLSNFLRSQFISATSILLSSSFPRHAPALGPVHYHRDYKCSVLFSPWLLW